VQQHELVFSERTLGIGAAVIIRELDLKSPRRQDFDDGSYLAAQEAPSLEIGGHGDYVKPADFAMVSRHDGLLEHVTTGQP
jgi:hypothetical protein